MSETTARLNIMTALQAAVDAHTSYALVVEGENRELVDQAAQVNPYVAVAVEFFAAEQADLGVRPYVKQHGQIVLSVVEKCGSGTAAGAALRDFLVPYFDMKNLGLVQTHAAEIHRGTEHKGWYYTPVIVNFWYHRLSA